MRHHIRIRGEDAGAEEEGPRGWRKALEGHLGDEQRLKETGYPDVPGEAIRKSQQAVECWIEEAMVEAGIPAARSLIRVNEEERSRRETQWWNEVKLVSFHAGRWSEGERIYHELWVRGEAAPGVLIGEGPCPKEWRESLKEHGGTLGAIHQEMVQRVLDEPAVKGVTGWGARSAGDEGDMLVTRIGPGAELTSQANAGRCIAHELRLGKETHLGWSYGEVGHLTWTVEWTDELERYARGPGGEEESEKDGTRNGAEADGSIVIEVRLSEEERAAMGRRWPDLDEAERMQWAGFDRPLGIGRARAALELIDRLTSEERA